MREWASIVGWSAIWLVVFVAGWTLIQWARCEGCASDFLHQII